MISTRAARVAKFLAATILLAVVLQPVTMLRSDAGSLVMPPGQFRGIDSIRTRWQVADHGKPLDTRAIESRIVAAVRARKLASTALHRYQVDGGGRFDVHVDVFHDASAAVDNWAVRYHPRTRSSFEPLGTGEEGWALADRAAGFRVRNVIVEIRAVGSAADVRAFAKAYSSFVARAAS